MKPRYSGFSLVELMVTVSIAAILLSIAIPSYNNYVRKSRRTDAKSALLDMASLEERFYSANNFYTNAAAQLGYPGSWPVHVGDPVNGYSIAQPAVNPATAPSAGSPGGTPATFSIVATPTGDQLNDTCTSFTVDSSGQQIATPNAATCWR